MGILHLVGAGTPTPTTSRFGTCYVLQLDEDYLMFDCGPAATHKLVQAGLFPTQIDYLFFTHHHFDHNVDYPCFLLCRWDQSVGQERRLRVWGPPPTQWITERLIGPDGAFSHDWKARVEAPLSQHVFVNRGGVLPRPAPSVEVCEVEPGDVIEPGHWTVTTARANHVQPWLTSLAYRVDAQGGSVVFTGDSIPCQPITQLARGADVLVVHCWDHQETMDRNGEAAGIAGTLDAAKMAHDAEVKTLILTHTGFQLNTPGSREQGIRDIASIYEGEIIFGDELMRLDLW
jgi:ribonuclease Z